MSPVSAASVSHAPNPVAAGQIIQFSARLTSDQNIASAHVHFIVYDANWNLLNETFTSNDNFTPFVTRTFTSNYQVPNIAGTYWMQVHVFNTAWTANLMSSPANYQFQVVP